MSSTRPVPGCFSAGLPAVASCHRPPPREVSRRHRRQIGCCWRRAQARSAGAAGPSATALSLASVSVAGDTRKGRCADLTAGLVTGTSAACRYAREAVAMLVARAPGAARVLTAKTAGNEFALIDEPVVRVSATSLLTGRPFCSGMRRYHSDGVNRQVSSRGAWRGRSGRPPRKRLAPSTVGSEGVLTAADVTLYPSGRLVLSVGPAHRRS
jgi:hypothetical protein